MTAKTRYRCRDCGASKVLPERPLSCARSLRTGCDHCEAITRHEPDGHGPFRELPDDNPLDT